MRPASAISFSLQNERALDSRQAGIGAARGAVGRGGEMGVAEAAVAARGDDDALARFGEIGEHCARLLIEDLGSDRRLQDRVGAAPAGAVLAHPVHSGLGLEMLLVAKVDERVEAVRAFDHDVAAAPAVAAVGAAEFDELLAPERDRARPAVARANVDARGIEKFHRREPLTRRAPSRRTRCAVARRGRPPNPRGRDGSSGIRPCPRAPARLAGRRRRAQIQIS